MTTILDFQIRSTTPEHYQLEVFERGQSQPLATAAFDYTLSFLTGFELNRLENETKLEILESSLERGYHLFHFIGHGIAPDGTSSTNCLTLIREK